MRHEQAIDYLQQWHARKILESIGAVRRMNFKSGMRLQVKRDNRWLTLDFVDITSRELSEHLRSLSEEDQTSLAACLVHESLRRQT